MTKYENDQQLTKTETFHRFGDLPKEIRDKIWDLVVRDECPGVHFFQTTWCEDPVPDAQECLFHEFKHSRSRAGGLFYFFVPDGSFPREQESHVLSSAGQASTYITDSGLWTACKESRDHVKKRHPEREQKLESKWNPSKHARSKSTIYAYFMAGDERQYISVLEHDLVVFRPDDFGIMDYYWHLPLAPCYYEANNPLLHVAVELDPSWRPPSIHDFRDGYHESQRNIQMALARAKMSSNLPNFWFIDYRIKRSTKASRPFLRSNRLVFRGNGCRFVEVRQNDDEWELEGGEPIFHAGSGAESEERCPSAFHMIRLLDLRSQVMGLPYLDNINPPRESCAWAEDFWEEQFETDMASENHEDFVLKSTGPRTWDCDESEFPRRIPHFDNHVKLGVLAHEEVSD